MVRCWLEQIVNSVRVELSQAGIVIGGGGVCDPRNMALCC